MKNYPATGKISRKSDRRVVDLNMKHDQQTTIECTRAGAKVLLAKYCLSVKSPAVIETGRNGKNAEKTEGRYYSLGSSKETQYFSPSCPGPSCIMISTDC